MHEDFFVMYHAQKTGNFVAKDASGASHQITIFHNIIQNADTDIGEEILGRPILKTETGDPVDKISTGKYRIATSEIELTSDDPGAF